MSRLDKPIWEQRAQEWPSGEAVLIRHEEEPTLWRRKKIAGILRGRRRVRVERASAGLPVEIERLVEERSRPADDDDGQVHTLADGSISIPVYREELVVTKRTVLAERIIIRKEAVTELQRVEADLRLEHVELETEGAADVVVEGKSASDA
jgi:uncharacterized protein (TIGR02271 family)